MSEVKTVKGIDEKTWADFKDMAAKDKVKLGLFFKNLVEERKRQTASFWKEVFNSGKIISDEEAEGMKKAVKQLRQEQGYRI